MPLYLQAHAGVQSLVEWPENEGVGKHICTHVFVCHMCTSINSAHSQGSRPLYGDFKKPTSHPSLYVFFLRNVSTSLCPITLNKGAVSKPGIVPDLTFYRRGN